MRAIIIISFLTLITAACSKEQTRERSDDCRFLYKESLKLIRSSQKAIENATDSMQADSLYLSFQTKLDSLNFIVGPNTDLELTEEENDTIFRNLMELKEAREAKMKNLAGLGKEEVADTLL